MQKSLCVLLVAAAVCVAAYCFAGTKPNEYQHGGNTWRESDAKNNHPNPNNQDNVPKWHTWDDVKDIWHSQATHQLTNWTFSHDSMTFQLVDRDGKVAANYLIKPSQYEDDKIFGFSGIASGTQIVVPEGYKLYVDPFVVDMSGRKPEEYGIAIFNAGEVVYYKKTAATHGFTIEPVRFAEE